MDDQVAAGETPLNEEEQDALLAATTASIRQIAAEDPAKIARLQRDIEVVSLNGLIARYADAPETGHCTGVENNCRTAHRVLIT